MCSQAGKGRKAPTDKRDDPVQVTKSFAIKEDLESRREDLAIRLEMANLTMMYEESS